MSKLDLFIIAAGKGSRMGGSLPKALAPINENEPNISTMLRQAEGKFDRIFIVTNIDIQEDWNTYFSNVANDSYIQDSEFIKNIYNIPIISGFGDGHALISGILAARKTLKLLEEKTKQPYRELSDEIVFCWGDVFIQYSETFDEILRHDLKGTPYSGWIPAVKEANPYVTLLVDPGLGVMGADFSKYGEKHPSGWHDQSIFRFNTHQISEALSFCHLALWKNGRYMTQGNELSTLYAFHYLYNSDQKCVVYETDYPTMSFNNPDEVKAIQKEILSK